jgi:uncharacterized protein
MGFYTGPLRHVQHHLGATLAVGAANLHDPHEKSAGFAMHCFVYASQRKANTYLWLLQKDNFPVIPASLAMLLGDLRFVLEVDLHAQRRLPHEDIEVVMEHLRTQGWHLQLPPQESLSVTPGPPAQDTLVPNDDEGPERQQE